MTGIGQKIKALRKKRGWSTIKLAAVAGISQSFLWRIEEKGATASWESYTKLARALAVKVEDLLSENSNVEEVPVSHRETPVLEFAEVIAWSKGGRGRVYAEMNEPIPTDLDYPESVFAVRLRGDSMAPRFNAGDIVVIDPTIHPEPGDFVLTINNDEECTFRQYRVAALNEKQEKVYELQPLNQHFPTLRSDRQKLEVLGVLVEARQKYRQNR